MKLLFKLSIFQRFSLLFAFVSLVFLVSGGWTFKVLEDSRIGGTEYLQMRMEYDGGSLSWSKSQKLADYYLICLELADEIDPGRRTILLENLNRARQLYLIQSKTLFAARTDARLKNDFALQAQYYEQSFYSSLYEDLLPALERGDTHAQSQIMQNLTNQFRLHLLASEHLMQQRKDRNISYENTIEERIQWASFLLFSVFLMALSSGLKIASVIRDSISYPLESIAKVAKRIAEGDFSARMDIDGGTEFGIICNAMNQMAASLERLNAELKSNAEAFEHQATHDTLTGLPNRALLKDRLQQSIAHARRYKRKFAILFIDLDDFKLINDSMGHHVGDEVLKCVSERMVRCVRSSDTVVRLGGDEFVVLLLDQSGDNDELLGILQKMRTAIASPIHLKECAIEITGCMGIAQFPCDGEDMDTLLRNADSAMYRAKELGPNSFYFYTAELNTTAHEKLELQEGLRHAISRSELSLVYQPLLDLKTRDVLGAEALLRWRRADGTEISPGKFIALAEESGMIVSIGEWVLRTACAQTKAWHDAGLGDISIAVNVSARQFREKQWVEQVVHALGHTQLPARFLHLELTESAIVQDVAQAISKMKELEAMGISLSIDDFGTGYSSLSALKSFPVRRLKIDKSFVSEIPGSQDAEEITCAVIELGHKLHMKVIAEGAEHATQVSFLHQNGCDEIQGFYFSKPLPPLEFENFIRSMREAAHSIDYISQRL